MFCLALSLPVCNNLWSYKRSPQWQLAHCSFISLPVTCLWLIHLINWSRLMVQPLIQTNQDSVNKHEGHTSYWQVKWCCCFSVGVTGVTEGRLHWEAWRGLLTTSCVVVVVVKLSGLVGGAKKQQYAVKWLEHVRVEQIQHRVWQQTSCLLKHHSVTW